MQRQRWTKEEVEILKNYYSNITIYDIEKLLPTRTKQAIQRMASFLGLKTDLSQAHSKYNIDKWFFSNIKNLESCKWAGLIASDGYFCKGNGIGISIKRTDKILLKEFVIATNFNGPIKDYEVINPSGNISKMCRVNFWSAKQWREDLLNHFNITKNKSLTLKPPDKLTLEQSLSYIVGYIEGDGSIKWIRNKSGTKSLKLSIVGTEIFLNWVIGIFKQISLSNSKIPKIHYPNNYPAWSITGCKAFEIVDILYYLECGYKMERKFGKDYIYG